ncbi:hypothetical protein [Kitasatospora nipponensis]|uniref:hypothetical protein n=1 Tax=Kitasatospora nipponensis TaxID=258049 RepID=UPI0031DEA526
MRPTVERCRRAAELAPNDPTPWVVLLGVLRMVRSGSQEVFQVWHEVVARDAWHREAHLQMLGYLSPEECGSHREVLDFVDAVRSGIPATAPAIGVELTAMVEHHHRLVARGGVDGLMARRQWTNARAAGALERAVTGWTEPGRLQHAAALADLNLLAHALVLANRLPEAGEAFRAIGSTVTPWPWGLEGDPLDRFGYWQGQALR